LIALALVAVFAGTLLLVVGTYFLVNRRRLEAAEALRSRLTPTAAPMATTAASILKEERASQLELLNRMLAGKSFTATLAKELERAGSKQSVGEFVLVTAVCAAAGFYLGQRFGVLIGALLAGVAVAIPFLRIRLLQRRRVKAFEAQLPEAIDMLVNAMKAGYSLQAAMKFIGEEMPEPLGPEFTRFYDEQRLGMDVRTALLSLQERVETLDLKMFVTALLIQRESGGNLAEVMTNLSTLMRDRVALRGQIDTLTAEPRLSAIVLALLPVAMFFVLSALNRDYVMPLLTTSIGQLLMAYGICSTVVGYVVLRKIGSIEV
jgi:tight adherence protein B